MDYSDNFSLWEEKFKTWKVNDELSLYDVLYDIMYDIDQQYDSESNIMIPERKNVFRMFHELPPDKVKVIFVFWEPYTTIYNNSFSACGRALATENGYINKSFRIMINYLKKLYEKENEEFDYSLNQWVSEGVFLFNYNLSVEQGNVNQVYPNESLLGKWHKFSNPFLSNFTKEYPDTVVVLFGAELVLMKKFFNKDFKKKSLFVHYPFVKNRVSLTFIRLFERINNKLNEKIKWI